MRILLKIHDKNNDTITYTEIMYAFSHVSEIPQSIELCVTHKVGEKVKVSDQMKSLKPLARTSEEDEVFKRIYYSPKQNRQPDIFAQNLKSARKYHRNDINLIEPIMNFNKPLEDSSNLTDHSTTGPVTSRTSAITVQPTVNKSITRTSPNIYKIQSRNRNANSYGQINCPYRLYPRKSNSIFINKHKNTIIPPDVMKKMDPTLYQEINDRIIHENPQYESESSEMPSMLWNRYGLMIGKEKEGDSVENSSKSHSITLMTRSNNTRTEENYSGSESARSATPHSPSLRSVASYAISDRSAPYFYSNGSS